MAGKSNGSSITIELGDGTDDAAVAWAIREAEKEIAKKTAQGRDNLAKQHALAALAALGGDTVGTDDVLFGGTRFIIPGTMDTKAAIRFLQRKMEADNEGTEFNRRFKYRPYDGAWCFIQAVKRHFGAMRQVPTPGFFGPNPPELRSVKVGPNIEEQVPWGRVVIPHLPDVIFELSNYRDREFGHLFQMNAYGANKYRAHVMGVFELVGEELKNSSLYRGKAITGGELEPDFLDLDRIDPRVVYSTDVMTQLHTNVWSPIKDWDKHEKAGLATKRAVLFEGPYGTGKSLAGMLTGRVATEAGWTYILCRPGQDDPFNVMATARLYEPAAIVIEDVDGFGGSDQQQNPMDVAKLLDAFDGIAAKGAKLVMVLTANHPERIHKGLLRPGRLDAVIHVGELDADGIRTLTQVVVGDRLGEVSEAEWAEFVTACEGYMPAFVREACERSVRYAISQGIDTVNGRALIDAAKGLRPQLDLMEGARERKNANPLDTALKEALGLNGMIEEALNQANIYDQDDDYMGTVRIG